LQSATLAILLLGAGLASANAETATSASPTAAIAASSIGADQRPIMLAQVPDVRIQLDRDHERDRHMDRRDHDPAIVIVPRRDHETTGSDRDEHRDRDHDRHDHD
jgi:hypothetical protein